MKDYGQKQKIFYFAVEREGKKKKGIYIKICDQCTWVVLWTVSQNEIR